MVLFQLVAHFLEIHVNLNPTFLLKILVVFEFLHAQHNQIVVLVQALEGLHLPCLLARPFLAVHQAHSNIVVERSDEGVDETQQFLIEL